VSINELTGLLEHLEQVPGRRSDIFRLAEERRVNSDQLLGLMETAELLGFATITQGGCNPDAQGRGLCERKH
jgi:hypothetical protein